MAWLQSRAFVGPKYEPDTSLYFYDWSALDLAEELPAIATAQCFAEGTLGNGETSFTVSASAGTPPPAGGFWIGPNGSGQAWEYCQYNDVSGGFGFYTISGIVREPTAKREHNGIHSAGAEVRFFWQLDTMIGEFNLSQTMDDNECIVDWTAEAKGWKFPQAALRDGHLFVYQTRTDVADPFTNTLIGFIDSRNMDTDYRNHSEWALQIVSSSGMINRERAPGIRKGKFDIALGAIVQSSQPLGSAWKERSSGDYIEAEPTFDASNAVDGEKKTLWIGDAFIGSEPDHYSTAKESYNGTRQSLDDPTIRTNYDGVSANVMVAGSIIISEIHLSPAVGQPGGYRYIELTVLDDFTLGPDHDLYIATDDSGVWLHFAGDGLNGINELVTGNTIIICENQDKFREENPSAEPTILINLDGTAEYNFLNSLSIAGDTVAVFVEPEAITAYFNHVVTWGTGGTAEIISANNPALQTSDMEFSPALATTSNGQTYHYNYAASSTAASNWNVGYLQTAGYSLDSKSWVLLELPPLGLHLAEDITSGYTGLVRLTDDTGDTTSGLAASGQIQIADEVVSYTKSSATEINITARAQASTAAAAHVKGDPVYVYENSLAINSFPIRTIELFRQGGSLLISDYTLRDTPVSYQPRTPDQQNYTADYVSSVTISGNTDANEIYNLVSTRRIRHLLIEFNEMSSAPARPRINEIRAIVDEDYFESEHWLAANDYAVTVAQKILTSVDFPDSAISTTGTALSGNHGTASRMSWDVLKEFCHYAGLFVEVGRDSKISISTNSYMIGDLIPSNPELNKDNVSRVSPIFAKPEPVGQVAIAWLSQDGEDKGTVYYPTVPGVGDVFEMPEQAYANEAAALARAEKIYWRKRYPYSFVVELAEGDPPQKPGMIRELVDWKLNSEMQPVNRMLWTKSVEHSIQQSQNTHTLNWHTVLNMVEIEREQE